MKFIIPQETKIGHVHLKVSNLTKSLSFYEDLLGFTVTQKIGDEAAFLSAGGYHHHIGLNTWYSKGADFANVRAPGLFHVAILFPERKDLANILKRLNTYKYPLSGAANHGVSEALYLDDPDKNGVELYWDKPKELWPYDNEGNLKMVTEHLNLAELLSVSTI
ncbi:VOC family protein [Pedobacter alpinus]|uniref:VOC family protein n=1 Tax=Pedobacter alpinus TaxID=1590643 RepID=A0ABW5TXD5_9SPHI